MEEIFPDKNFLTELKKAVMPFGKYKGRYLKNIPEDYLLWMKLKGFPPGKLGNQLASVLEIKQNGLENILY